MDSATSPAADDTVPRSLPPPAGPRGYVIAALLMAAVVGVRLVIERLVGPAPQAFFILFCAAAVTAAWQGGPRAGLLAIAVGVSALATLFMEPLYSIGVSRPDDQAALLGFVVAGLVGTWLAGIARSGRRRPSRQGAPRFAWLACFVAANLVAAWLAEGMRLIPGVSIIFWPPAGIFIAALLLNERATWPWWVAAACVAELAAGVLWYHNPPQLALLYFSANAAEALTAALLVQTVVAGTAAPFSPRQLESPRNALLFAALAGGLAPVVGATIIATADELLGKHDFRTAWQLVWLGDGMGVLLSAPLALTAVQVWRDRRRGSVRPGIEFLLTCGLTVLLTWLALRGALPTVYIVLPAIVWAAVRFQVRGAWLLLTAVILTVAVYTGSGRGEFAGTPEQMHERIVALQLFLGVCASTALIVAGLSASHVRARERLRVANQLLERRVSDRTAALRESEQRFRLSLQGNSVIIAQCDLDLRYVWIHDSHPALRPDAIIGRRDTEIADNEGTRALERLKREAMEKLVDVSGEITFPMANGPVTYEIRAEPRFGPAGNLESIVTVGVNTTARRQAEERLRESEHRLRLALAAAATGLWDWDMATGAVTWSPECFAIHGIPEGGFGGTVPAFEGLIHPEDRERVWASVRLAVDQGTLHRSEFRIVRPDGDVRWVTNMGGVIYDDRGTPQRMVGTITDITARKHTEMQLQEADRKKDEFLATLAHELRNPLAPIRNGLEIMKLATADADAVEKARAMMERQVGQMTRLIDDLMDLSRISQGKIQLVKERILLADAVRFAVDTSRPLVEAQDHELVVEVPSEPVYVEGDLTRLSQVLANLLNNAAKYTERGGRIRLTVERQGTEVQIRVTDNGIGIPTHMLDTVFDMFTQVDRSLEKAQGGLGIGLNIAKRLVQKHGGAITAESGGPGTGSTFTVRLPVTTPLPAGQRSQDRDVRGPAAGRQRILVVDDNRDSATSLAMILRLNGNETATAHDGLAAVAAAESFRPHVILLDIGMPGLNGYDACRRIRAAPWGKDVVMVACSGWGKEEDKRRARDAGFDHHLTKPADLAALEALLADGPAEPVRG